MNKEIITNQNLMHIDYARTERIAFINNISDNAPDVLSCPTCDLPTQKRRMTNTSGMNKRSIKVQAKHHANWWRVRCILSGFLKSTLTLKHRLVPFSRRHHRQTIARLYFLRNLSVLHTTLVHQRNRAGLRQIFSAMPVNKNI
jgi:hypothetical protein